MATKPTDMTLIELRDAIASGQCSSAEATQAYLDRIDQLNPMLGAYREVYHDRAMNQAGLVDEGVRSGPLAGVPIAIKDVLCTDYGTTTCCSRMLAGYESLFTATAVAKLEAAGAVILGKTAMDEFAMGSSCEHCATGKVLNPWGASRTPGGSSGGAAAAMAADLCAGSIGSDTGGSIRQPAALCGVVGFKPTYGRVSRYGLVAFASSLDQIGPLTRTVNDAALLTAVMAGHDPKDSTSSTADVPEQLATLSQQAADAARGKRIGLAKQYQTDANDPAVAAALERAVKHLKSSGCEIVDIDLPHTDYGIATYYIVAPAEASSNLARYDGIHYGHRAAKADDLIDLYHQSRSEGFGPEVQRRIMLGTYVLSSGYYDAYYLRALKVRRLIKQDFDAAFESCDTILCPTTPGPAFRLGEKSGDVLAMYLNDIYTVNANLAGLPAVSIPAGTTAADDGDLPIGLQLIGKTNDEVELLAAGSLLEAGINKQPIRPEIGNVKSM